MSLTAYPTYDSYKDSRVEWIGDIPSEWQVEPGRQCVYESRDKNTRMKESTVLSLSYGRVIVKDKDKLTGLAKDVGIITSAYINLRPKAQIDQVFLHYLLHSYDVKKVFYALGSGLRQNLSYLDFKYLKLPIPSPTEQRAIAAFLDEKCAGVDEAVRIKEAQIALLRERRQILIQQAVTRGLNPAAPMKDSGIDGIGQIPAHWEIKRGKWLFTKVDRPIGAQDEIVTCFRDGQVTLRRNRRTEGFTNAFKEHGYQGIQRGDLVIHAMDAFAGAVGVSDSDGKATPVYSVCVPISPRETEPAYFALLLRQIALSGLLISIAKGIRERSTDFRFKDFANLEFPNPSIDEQHEIIRYIDMVSTNLDDAITIKQDQIAALKEYKASLINAAVTGKIKVI